MKFVDSTPAEDREYLNLIGAATRVVPHNFTFQCLGVLNGDLTMYDSRLMYTHRFKGRPTSDEVIDVIRTFRQGVELGRRDERKVFQSELRSMMGVCTRDDGTLYIDE